MTPLMTLVITRLLPVSVGHTHLHTYIHVYHVSILFITLNVFVLLTAGFHQSVAPSGDGLHIAFAGYNDGLLKFASNIMRTISTFEAKKGRFVVLKVCYVIQQIRGL